MCWHQSACWWATFHYRILGLLDLVDWRWSGEQSVVLLSLFWFVLFIAGLAGLFDGLNNCNCIFHSLFDLFSLSFNGIFLKIFPFPNFINVSDIILRNEQFGKILKNDLIVLIIKPENISFTSFIMLDNIHIHGSFSSLPKFISLPLYYLLII